MVKFTCDRCGRSYNVAEDLRGRAFKMKCKYCGHFIVVKPAGPPTGAPIPEVTPRPFPGAAVPPKLPETESDAGLPKPAASGNASAVPSPFSAQAGAALPVPEETPPPDGYVEFVLDDRPAPGQEPPAAAGEEIEPVAVPPPLPAEPIVDATSEGLRDPLAGWSAIQEEIEPRLAAEDIQADAETTDRALLPPPPAVAAPPLRPSFAAAPKKSGMPKALIYAAAAAVVVVVIIAVVATRKGEPPAPSAAPSQPAASAAPSPARPTAPVELTPPKLAAPDPHYAQGLAAGGKGASQPDEAGESARREKGGEEGGLQGRAVAPAESKPAEGAPPQVAAPAKAPAPEPRAPAPEPKKVAHVRGPDRAIVARVIATNRRSIDECLAEAVRSDPSLKQRGKRLNLVLTVSPSGDVVSSTLDDAQFRETQLSLCLGNAARGLTFPAFSEGDSVPVKVPLAFGKTK